jgi:hypothetical protein
MDYTGVIVDDTKYQHQINHIEGKFCIVRTKPSFQGGISWQAERSECKNQYKASLALWVVANVADEVTKLIDVRNISESLLGSSRDLVVRHLVTSMLLDKEIDRNEGVHREGGPALEAMQFEKFLTPLLSGNALEIMQRPLLSQVTLQLPFETREVPLAFQTDDSWKESLMSMRMAYKQEENEAHRKSIGGV